MQNVVEERMYSKLRLDVVKSDRTYSYARKAIQYLATTLM